jgi:hypothetical protein
MADSGVSALLFTRRATRKSLLLFDFRMRASFYDR